MKVSFDLHKKEQKVSLYHFWCSCFQGRLLGLWEGVCKKFLSSVFVREFLLHFPGLNWNILKASIPSQRYQPSCKRNAWSNVCLQGSARHLTECVDLLLQLGEPASGLCDDFLSHARTKLEDDLATLTRLAEAAAEAEQEGAPHQEAGETGAEEPAKEVPQEEQSGSGGGNGVPLKPPHMVSSKCAPLAVLNLICNRKNSITKCQSLSCNLCFPVYFYHHLYTFMFYSPLLSYLWFHHGLLSTSYQLQRNTNGLDIIVQIKF